MKLSQQIISKIPLTEIWNEQYLVSAERIRRLNADDIADMLRNGKVNFVVANIGDKPKWIPPEESFKFWKSEVKMRVANPDTEKFYLTDFPNEYFYFAEEWKSEEFAPLIILMIYH